MNNMQVRPGGFSILPPVVKNLLIINGLFFLATIAFAQGFDMDLNDKLGLYYIGSDNFSPIQFITYMFLHGGISHIFFNMFALWMFGNTIENLWGAKRFLIYYFVTGLGAAVIQQLVLYIDIMPIMNKLADVGVASETIKDLVTTGKYNTGLLRYVSEQDLYKLFSVHNTPTVGASGAVFGILLAFGMLFPNALIYVYFAIPIKAKWFVIIYGAFELWSGIASNPGDNIAHFAHLGGMIFGFILIKIWQKKDIDNIWM